MSPVSRKNKRIFLIYCIQSTIAPQTTSLYSLMASYMQLCAKHNPISSGLLSSFKTFLWQIWSKEGGRVRLDTSKPANRLSRWRISWELNTIEKQPNSSWDSNKNSVSSLIWRRKLKRTKPFDRCFQESTNTQAKYKNHTKSYKYSENRINGDKNKKSLYRYLISKSRPKDKGILNKLNPKPRRRLLNK